MFNMKKQHLYLLALTIIISCSKASNPKELFLKHYQKGSIIEKVECKGSSDQTYCLYMPSGYDITKSLPVIYAFDPHGDGHLPVALLKDIAEKYNYVIIGSNNCRNGLSSDDLNYSLSQLLNDTKNKLAIDTNRIFLTGFSGGARIACALAQSIAGAKGVIACSAGFQPLNAAPPFTFIGISSSGDMNYLEMKKLDNTLQKFNADNYFMLFEGKHEWCPKFVLEEAITMLEIKAMNDKTIAVNKSVVDGYLTNNLLKAKQLKESNQTDSLYKAYNILKRTIKSIDKLTDIAKLKTLLTEIEQKPDLQRYINELNALEIYESMKQQEFMAAFENKQDLWWNAELKRLDTDANDKNGLKSNQAKRLKGYISLSCYSYSNRALQTQNWKYAALFTHIYQKVDPENPDCYYALASLYANTNQKEKAVVSLQSAIKLGFSNKNKLQNDPILNPLHGMPEFEKLLN